MRIRDDEALSDICHHIQSNTIPSVHLLSARPEDSKFAILLLETIQNLLDIWRQEAAKTLRLNYVA